MICCYGDALSGAGVKTGLKVTSDLVTLGSHRQQTIVIQNVPHLKETMRHVYILAMHGMEINKNYAHLNKTIQVKSEFNILTFIHLSVDKLNTRFSSLAINK